MLYINLSHESKQLKQWFSLIFYLTFLLSNMFFVIFPRQFVDLN
uniref:Uncharacterized protein n=1 Tax=Bartonella schoenbuchensis TaxID=165694 RepID=A0A024LQH4_9HYPH|nr:hypothetical protein BN1046_00604 [Bartonella schoenbuchensis]